MMPVDKFFPDPIAGAEASDTPSGSDPLSEEIHLLAESGLFDKAYYLENNPDVAAAGLDPLAHFCEHGWRELRKPWKDFDVWWYWVMHMDPAREGLNPLVHYSQLGRQSGLRTHPPSYEPRPGVSYAAGQQVRRVCLFAGFDPDGIVDDCVVEYVRELSRFADVYYLADCVMRDGELDKLAPYTRGRWAYRHGAYDFGSWSALARDHLGWKAIGEYDELLQVNDSAYLLSSLDPVFEKMDGLRCDWWGMQATKGLAFTRKNPANQFAEPIALRQVKSVFVNQYENDYVYDFHVGSYFVVYRKAVLADEGFRRQLDAIHAEKSKLRVVQKYEIGITHYLLGKQFNVETFVDHLYPFHPLYTKWHFELIRHGFPLLKRYFLAENHYDTPDLARWKSVVRELVPEAPVDLIERSLKRVSDDDKLQRSFAITTDDRGRVVTPKLLDANEFMASDEWTPKFDHWWAFPVCAFNDTFSGNERALFEEVRNDPSIKKIVLTRRRAIDVDGENVVVAPLKSPEGQYYLLRARQIFIKHSVTRNVVHPVSPDLHNLINLWHGIPLKRIGYASLDMQDKLDAVAAEHAKCRAVISSSKIDTLAMAAAFYPLSFNNVWCTGLPRNDFILCPQEMLPSDLREELARLETLLQGRRLILFAPTFKAAQADAYYHFSIEEIDALHSWLRTNNAVLGVREHMADQARTYYSQLRGRDTIDLADRHYPDVEMLYRQASALITDYSSCFIDFLLTGRPVISFAYDHDAYAGAERGLFYDMDCVFPGQVCRKFSQVLAALNQVFSQPEPLDQASYESKRRLFFDHLDDDNAWRVVKKVKKLYMNRGSDDKRNAL